MRLKDMTGKRVGKLTVLKRHDGKKYMNGESLWECECSCSDKKHIIVPGSALRNKGVKSCGCIRNPNKEDFAKSIQLRLFQKSKLVGQCIEWTGFRNKGGYGELSVTYQGKESTWRAHRAAWFVYHGDIPEGGLICHSCDNPACIRGDHLFLGTPKDNMQDKSNKGRGNYKRGEQASRVILNATQVRNILKMKGKGRSSHEIAKRFKVAATTIRAIWQRRNWKHVGTKSHPALIKKD